MNFGFFEHPVYPYQLKEGLIVRLELNSSEKIILRSGDIEATYKISDISVECDAIFEERYATKIGGLNAGTTSIPYFKVASIHYQKQRPKIDINNLSVSSLQSLLLLFPDKSDEFANKNEGFYNPTI